MRIFPPIGDGKVGMKISPKEGKQGRGRDENWPRPHPVGGLISISIPVGCGDFFPMRDGSRRVHCNICFLGGRCSTIYERKHKEINTEEIKMQGSRREVHQFQIKTSFLTYACIYRQTNSLWKTPEHRIQIQEMDHLITPHNGIIFQENLDSCPVALTLIEIFSPAFLWLMH